MGEAWLRRGQEAVVFVLLVFLLQASAELAELEGEALTAAVGLG